MAGISCGNIEIDYYMNGEVYYFKDATGVVYDSSEPEKSDDLWLAKLVDAVWLLGLNTDDGKGLHAFVRKLVDDGILTTY